MKFINEKLEELEDRVYGEIRRLRQRLDDLEPLIKSLKVFSIYDMPEYVNVKIIKKNVDLIHSHTLADFQKYDLDEIYCLMSSYFRKNVGQPLEINWADLNEREKDIIKCNAMSWGYFHTPQSGMTRKELAKKYDISSARVSRILKDATVKLYEANKDLVDQFKRLI